MAHAIAAVALFVLSASAAYAQSSPEQFFDALRWAIRSGDRAAVIGRIRYPIAVRIGGLRVPFSDAAALLARYDEIFTPALVSEITQQVRVQQINGQWRITAIDVPDAGADPPPAAGVQTSEPRRVGIRGGPRPTRVSGALQPGGTDAYVLFVPKGRVLEVRVERVQGRAALLRVVHAATGAPFNPRIAGESRVVTGTSADSADYRIEIRRGDSGDPAPLPYVVALSVR
jgi:hypothetical protein